MKPRALLLLTLLALSGPACAGSAYHAELCEHYRERLKDYRLDGVHSYNLWDGTRRRLEAREARRHIEQTRRRMEIHCDRRGVLHSTATRSTYR